MHCVLGRRSNVIPMIQVVISSAASTTPPQSPVADKTVARSDYTDRSAQSAVNNGWRERLQSHGTIATKLRCRAMRSGWNSCCWANNSAGKSHNAGMSTEVAKPISRWLIVAGNGSTLFSYIAGNYHLAISVKIHGF